VTDEEELHLVFNHFQIGLRDLYARDIVAANDGDVRMGTFVLCAAFLDVLSLTYSAGVRVKGKTAEAKWSLFVSRFFGNEYAFLRAAYNSFRNRLLHNYSAAGILFTHEDGHEHLHCKTEPDGQVWMHRESFVHDVLRALDAFETEVTTDSELRGRVLKHWEQFPPMGLVIRETVPHLAEP
jgi:hypothetical protein